MIPPLLHQIWMTWASPEPPEPMRRLAESWTRLNPGLVRRLYIGDECRAFVAREFPAWLATYDNFPFPIQRVDFFRYLVVYRLGGIYADLDMECLRPMDRFLQHSGSIFSVEAHLTPQRQRELRYARPWQVANCIFAAEPGQPFLRRLIERVVEVAATRPARTLADVEDTTGPRLLTRLFQEAPDPAVRLLRQTYWMAPDAYASVYPLNARMFARHHFLGGWKQDGAGQSLWRRWIERNRLPNPFPANLFHHANV